MKAMATNLSFEDLSKDCERSITKMSDAEALAHIGRLIDDAFDASFERGAKRALYLLDELSKRKLVDSDGALVEYVGDYPVERFDHVHLWQEDPYAAFDWYVEHLNATPRAQGDIPPKGSPDRRLRQSSERSWPALSREGMFREPRASVLFGDIALAWYSNQSDEPLVPSRGQLQDHLAFSVTDLDAWVDKLASEGVIFLEQPYQLGDTRAVMIEGPSREALELVEVA